MGGGGVPQLDDRGMTWGEGGVQEPPKRWRNFCTAPKNKEKLIDSQDIRKKTSSENRSIKTVFEESLGCKYNYYSCNQCSFKTKINCELIEHRNNQHCQPQNSNIEKKTDKRRYA